MADRDPIVFATYVEMEQLSEAMASAWAEDSTLPAVFEMLLVIRELGEHLTDERRAGLITAGAGLLLTERRVLEPLAKQRATTSAMERLGLGAFGGSV